MSGIIERLTEGIVNRDLKQEGHALLSKWEKTGLLEGLNSERNRNSMARLLENQAKELLREASTMAGGDVEGFAAVAFPIVRRVFAGLIANDLVSVQPMSLPSGLIFFLDFQFTPGTNPRLGQDDNGSIYGGGVVGLGITGGVDLSGDNASRGPYGLNTGYSSPTGSITAAVYEVLASGTYGGPWYVGDSSKHLAVVDGSGSVWADFNSIVRYDPDFTSGSTTLAIVKIPVSAMAQFNKDALQSVQLSSSVGNAEATTTLGGLGLGARQVRRLTQYSGSHKGGTAKTHILCVIQGTGSHSLEDLSGSAANVEGTFAEADDFTGTPTAGASDAVGAVAGTSTWGLENDEGIPEIDIKVDSIAVTAVTKKLKAKWTPELGQDLNAYHNLDAEVELTQILSEQIALEIDREILADLVNGARAGTYYWARSPGLFVERDTGIEIGASSAAPDFTGTVSEWYETLVETINDVSAQIHRKTLRGGANFVVVSPETAAILEFTAGYRANVTVDGDTGNIGAVKTGSLSKKWDVYVDPYFLRNVVLVGRRGGSFLESGYVYAPYVPLQTTPTIFGPEDFVPRKGVMTRYAKKMVRPDMYGLVVIRGMLGEAGSES
jgi:hypothetical protein